MPMKHIPVFFILFMLPVVTIAADVGLGVKAGTTGIGADLTFPLTETLNVRGGLYYLSFSVNYEGDAENENVDAKLKLEGFPLLLDWHPMNGGFRVTAGAVINSNIIEGNATNEAVELDGTDFDLSSFSAEASFDSVAPYFGIGWGNAIDQEGRWTFAFDLGLLYQGSVDITASAVSANAAFQDIVNTALEAEIRNIEEDAKDYKFYPVVTLGVAYRF